MEPKFNIDRPKIGDEEIRKNQNFEELVSQFKKQSLKQAKGDESWRKNKKVRYTSVIAGVTVICTITLLALLNSEKTKQTHETLTTQTTSTSTKKAAATSAFINPPSQKLKTNYNSYKVNNARGGEIKHPSSSKIKIPKSTFVDKAGRDIVGDVTIEYREFHDAGDIILSGIPMGYDSAGHSFNFETAGMFEIKGSQNGEPVFIKPDKKVEVELASTTKDTRFNQYYLDTTARNWQYLKRDTPSPLAHAPSASVHKKADVASASEKTSPKLLALKEQVEVIIPKKIDSVKVIYVKKVSKLPKYNEPPKPQKATPGRPTFRLDGSYSEFPELSAFSNVLFEVGPENNNYSKDMHSITWSDVKVSEGPVKGKNYLLTLSYRSRVEKMVVYPTLSGADLTKAEEKYVEKFADYERLVSRRNDDEKKLLAELEAKQQAYLTELRKRQDDYDKEKARLINEAKTLAQNDLASNFNVLSQSIRATRLFSISQFGIYNSDCPHPLPNGASVNPTFVMGEGFVNPDYIYLVDHSKKIVYNINLSSGLSINYDPQNEYSVCVFQKNKLFLCNKNSFSETIKSGTNKFRIVPLPEGADNLLDFKKSLEI